MADSWINDCVVFCIMEKDIVFWQFYLIYFGVIILGHNQVFEGKNLTILFAHFLRSFNKWECAFKKYCLFTFLIFLITGKIISTSLLCFLIINFAIILYFKTFIKFKSNYQRSLKLPKLPKILNNILYLNKKLHNFSLLNRQLCCFCKIKEETISHLFNYFIFVLKISRIKFIFTSLIVFLFHS